MRASSFCFTAFLLLITARADAQVYRVTEIGGITAENGSSTATDINELGHVSGYMQTGDYPRAFVWANGTITEFGNETRDYAIVYAGRINILDQVVGTRYLADGSSAAFLWQNGATLDLPGLSGENDTRAAKINDAGVVTGISGARPFIFEAGVTRDFTTLPGASDFRSAVINNAGAIAGTIQPTMADPTYRHAAIWADGQVADLGDIPGGAVTPYDGGNFSAASEINSVGQVVGRSDGANGYHAFFWSDGTMRDLGALPGLYNWSEATDINDAGTVVGFSGDEYSHAFIWDSINGMRDLNSLLDETGSGWTLTRAYGINNRGQIVGAALHEGQTRGFLLTPIPEPSTLASAIAIGSVGIIAALAALFRRRDKFHVSGAVFACIGTTAHLVKNRICALPHEVSAE